MNNNNLMILFFSIILTCVSCNKYREIEIREKSLSKQIEMTLDLYLQQKIILDQNNDIIVISSQADGQNEFLSVYTSSYDVILDSENYYMASHNGYKVLICSDSKSLFSDTENIIKVKIAKKEKEEVITPRDLPLWEITIDNKFNLVKFDCRFCNDKESFERRLVGLWSSR